MGKKEIYSYPPQIIPEGYKVVEVECHMCYGNRYYSGRYGMTACECHNGKEYILVRIYKKRIQNGGTLPPNET